MHGKVSFARRRCEERHLLGGAADAGPQGVAVLLSAGHAVGWRIGGRCRRFLPLPAHH